MTLPQDQSLSDLIRDSALLLDFEKAYLLEKLPELGPLDKLKSKQALLSNTTPEVILRFRRMRQNFIEREKENHRKNLEPQRGFFNQAPKPKQPATHSLLVNPLHLGTPSPRPPGGPRENLSTLANFTRLTQLGSLNPTHVVFEPEQNAKQQINRFIETLEAEFEKIPDPLSKRNYFVLFFQSPLFQAYLHSGLTALKHPEIKPRASVLNIMQRIDPRFLNRTQFEATAQITHGLRTLTGL